MRLSLGATIKMPLASICIAIEHKGKRIFQERCLYNKTRNAFIFRKFIRKVLVYYSVLITYLEVLFLLFFPDWLLMMNIILFVTLVILVPFLYIVITFLCSWHRKSRNEWDRYIGYGKFSTEDRLERIAAKLKLEEHSQNVGDTNREIREHLKKLARQKRKVMA
jgi:hypothetical protein